MTSITSTLKRRTGSVSILAWLSIAAVGLSACALETSTQVDEEARSAAVTSQALETLPVSSVPIPINSAQVSTWDGTYPELLAADALAECTLTHRVGVTEGGTTDNDWFLREISLDMSNALCSTAPGIPAGYTAAEGLFYRWIEGRKIKACNLDPATQLTKAVDITYTQSVGTASPYSLPSLTRLQASSPAPALGGAELNAARNLAQNEIHYAWLNLCMAQKLNENLESIQVALISEQDLLQLQEIVRERAKRAVHQYASLIRVMDGTTMTQFMSNPWYYVSLLRYWPQKATNWNQTSTRLGQDLAFAVRLLVDASEQHTQTLVRASSAQQGFGQYASTPTDLAISGALDSGLKGPRQQAFSASYGAAGWGSLRGVVTDMSAPEVATLLSLARSANALVITGANRAFDVGAIASTMLTAVENYVRGRDCVNRGQATNCNPIGSATPDQYVVRQRFNVQPAHARALVQGLLEHLYGQPGRDLFAPNGSWTYRFDSQDVLVGLPLDLTDRLPGTHTYTGDFSSAGGGTLTIDPASRIEQLPSAAMQSQAWAYFPYYDAGNTLHPYDLGFGQRLDNTGHVLYGEDIPSSPLGSQQVLAYARAILSRAHVNALDILTAAGSPMWSLFEQAIGARSVLIHRIVSLGSGSTTAACAVWAYMPTGGGAQVTPASCTLPRDSLSGTNILYRLNVNTRSGDPYSYIARRTFTNPAIVPAFNVSTLQTSTIDPAIAAITGEVVRWVQPPAVAPNTYLELALANSSLSTAGLLPMMRGRLDPPVTYSQVINTPYMPTMTFQRASMFGRTVTYGGRLNRQIERMWEFEDADWSRPRYDGLDLPSKWAPVGDASLHGGQVGEEAYQYFLRTASDAASEATSAIDKAIELLSLESQDELALAQAQERATTLSQFEEKSFCGAAAAGISTTSPSCTPSYTSVVMAIPTCPAMNASCSAMRTDLTNLLGPIATGSGASLASDVASQIDNAVPSFSRYQGGQLQGLLSAQWAAWGALKRALQTAVDASVAGQGEIDAAVTEEGLSNAEFGSTIANQLVQLAMALSGFSTEQAQINTLNAQRAAYDTDRLSAADEAEFQCSEAAMNQATSSGYSFSGRNRDADVDPETGHWEVPPSEGGSRSWSPGAVEAQIEKCRQATDGYADALALEEPQELAITSGIAAAESSIAVHNLTLFVSLPAQFHAALERAKVAPARTAAVKLQVAGARSTQLQLVQSALTTLLDAGNALAAASTQAKLAKARVDFERHMTEVPLTAQFNLRRGSRSFDLWRARALSENARKLAVSARRAIESRFVVELADLKAPETFVEAPSLWADEIYSSDLKPPFAIGLTSAPSSNSGTYSSKLEDYVNNLELFVQGYPISRPSASVRSDADVVQLPGPAAISEAIGGDGTVYEYRDIDSGGWSFYCPATSTWVRNLQSATFNPSSWTISTVCAGQPATRARLAFWLDPWGRVQGTRANPPFTARYNARWRSLALNLVGSGIRDCSRADDPNGCYAEPFIRYELKHVGPVIVTDHAQEWTQAEVPIGIIEGGKALASEEWVDPVANGFQNATVNNVARHELAGRPLGGAYQLTLELTEDVRPERIERIQVLFESDYWVRQE